MAQPIPNLRLTEVQILAWADAHFARHERWPEVKAFRVEDAPADLPLTWKTIDSALHDGRYGLAGGTSLPRLLTAKRHRLWGSNKRRLTAAEIVDLARDHFHRTGRWPAKTSGRVLTMPGRTWSGIDAALQANGDETFRTMTLAGLLAERVGKRNPQRLEPVTIEQILAWADAHHRRTGQWPLRKRSGEVVDAPGETWHALDTHLRRGTRSLPVIGGLSELLDQYRNVRNKAHIPPVTAETILKWADDHFARTGDWPGPFSGAVHGVPNEDWKAIDDALFYNRRGLRFGKRLTKFLTLHRGRRDRRDPPKLTLKQILRWADAHYARTGEWPSREAGPIPEAPGDKWSHMVDAMSGGRRGLKRGNSLSKLLMRERPGLYRRRGLPLKRNDILEWALAHHELHGSPPTRDSGPVRGVKGETWAAIDAALRAGSRTLRGGTSLAELLEHHYREPFPGAGGPLTEAIIVQWAEAFHQRVGYWPSARSAYTDPLRREKWSVIDTALREGLRGLAGGSSLATLLRGHRRAGQLGRPPRSRHRSQPGSTSDETSTRQVVQQLARDFPHLGLSR